MPGFLKGINYISPLKYATLNMFPYALRNVKFSCSEDDPHLNDKNCLLQTGEDVLDLYEMNGINPAHMLWALVGMTVVYRLLAYLILKLSTRIPVWGRWF
jgi:hypothetical protein